MITSFRCTLFISFNEADPAGILFYGNIFSMALEAYEQFVIQGLSISWKEWFTHPDWVVPVKQAKADFFAPLFPGEHCEAVVTLSNIGTSSFQLKCDFYQRETLCAAVETVHVFCSRSPFQKQPIPKEILEKLTIATC